jgi:hypothetical protein
VQGDLFDNNDMLAGDVFLLKDPLEVSHAHQRFGVLDRLVQLFPSEPPLLPSSAPRRATLFFVVPARRIR